MHSRRTSPPTSPANPHIYRPPNPGDHTQDLITRLRQGDDSDLLTEDDEEEAAADASASDGIQRQYYTDEPAEEIHKLQIPAPVAARPPVGLPAALARLLGTEAEEELMAVARFLDHRNKKKLTLVFHTPIGDVKCPVNWSSTEPSHLCRSKHLLLILVRSSESMFTPLPGSELEISFLEHRDQPRLRVLCLAPPMQLYPGVGIDLLCFLPQTDPVEKQGVLHDGAPSVVSGRPSTHAESDTGEPVADGEKSAGVKVTGVDWGADSGTTFADVEDFDKPRS